MPSFRGTTKEGILSPGGVMEAGRPMLSPIMGKRSFFHWANKGQHYVKTGENFKDYTFNVDILGGSYRVRFVLAAACLPPGNTRGDTRYFFPFRNMPPLMRRKKFSASLFNIDFPRSKKSLLMAKTAGFRNRFSKIAWKKFLNPFPTHR